MKTVSEILRERREALGISVQKVSKETKIPVEHINFVEQAKWKQFASFTFIQGIINKYSNYLQCDTQKISALLRRDLAQNETKFILNSSYKEKNFFMTRQLALLGFLLLFISYFIFQILVFIRKPPLTVQVTSPIIKSGEPLEIKGTTERGALIYLNDERIFQNSNGSFQEEIYLKKGKRVIRLKVIGTNGTIVEKTISVTVVN